MEYMHRGNIASAPYMPMPRYLQGMPVSSTAKIVYLAIVATHTNTENIHNHIMIRTWNYDGIKWHNCHDTYREIRKYLDRLCKEYGLNVLEKTKDQVPVRWKDKRGNTRCFEPMKQKQELREKQKKKKISG